MPEIVMGHFSFGCHRILGIEPRYATILRHPIDRVVSLYRHQSAIAASGGPMSPVIAHALRSGMTLNDFVASELTEMTNNHMCRILAGIPPEAGMKLTDDWLSGLALHNLRRHYVIAGTVKAIGLAVVALSAQLGWGEQSLGTENVSTGYMPTLGAKTRETLRAFNALDLRLFEEVSGYPERYGVKPQGLR